LGDRFFIMYCKDNIAYPVALSKEQEEAFDWFIKIMMPEPITIVSDMPQGEVQNIIKSKGVDFR